MKRLWDPKGTYIDGFLKEYEHWVLEVSFRQHTLGCFIIFAKRKVQRISELKQDELVELASVMQEIEGILGSIEEFKPDRFNYLQLGNGLNHLHFHGIPRYKEPRTFGGREWIDSTWGHPPVWQEKDSDKKNVLAVKKAIKKSLK